MNTSIVIRAAKEQDLEEILNMIRELAIYEKAENEVVVTLSELTEDFKKGIFEAQVAVNSQNEIAGMALYYITYSTWKGKMLYLEDFVVKEAFRRQGIGKGLFDAVIQEAKNWGCRLMKWQVLDWNEPAIDFYKSYDAIIEDDWYNGKLFF
jgi:GNAT superfamily N-acetyltransferase